METGKPKLTPKETIHITLMRELACGLSDTPLVLKGGTALLLAYGLDRFSDDLDFDAPHKINLENRIGRIALKGITITGIDVLKDTDTTTRYRVNYHSAYGKNSLKVEVSYRTPANEEDVVRIDGMRVASIEKIVEQKLDAAENRTSIRDIYDLAFIVRSHSDNISPKHIDRLQRLSTDPDTLSSRYRQAYMDDNVIGKITRLEDLVLEFHYGVAGLQPNQNGHTKEEGSGFSF